MSNKTFDAYAMACKNDVTNIVHTMVQTAEDASLAKDMHDLNKILRSIHGKLLNPSKGAQWSIWNPTLPEDRLNASRAQKEAARKKMEVFYIAAKMMMDISQEESMLLADTRCDKLAVRQQGSEPDRDGSVSPPKMRGRSNGNAIDNRGGSVSPPKVRGRTGTAGK
jgi:hypothetical protein